MASWSTKVAVSLKCIKIEEKLLWKAYRGSQKLSGHYKVHRVVIFAIAQLFLLIRLFIVRPCNIAYAYIHLS